MASMLDAAAARGLCTLHTRVFLLGSGGCGEEKVKKAKRGWGKGMKGYWATEHLYTPASSRPPLTCLHEQSGPARGGEGGGVALLYWNNKTGKPLRDGVRRTTTRERETGAAASEDVDRDRCGHTHSVVSSRKE